MADRQYIDEEVIAAIDARIRATKGGEWREDLHPRHPAGSPEGGEFAPKDGAGEMYRGFRTGELATRWADLDKLAPEERWKSPLSDIDLIALDFERNTPVGEFDPANDDAYEVLAKFLKWRTGADLTPEAAQMFERITGLKNGVVDPTQMWRYMQDWVKPGTAPADAVDVIEARPYGQDKGLITRDEWRDVRKAFADAGAVHTVGDIPRIQVEEGALRELGWGTAGMSDATQGIPRVLLTGNWASEIVRTSPAVTALHEYGHALDAYAFSGLSATWVGFNSPGVDKARINDAFHSGLISSEDMPEGWQEEQPPKVANAFDRLMVRMNQSALVKRLDGIGGGRGDFEVGGKEIGDDYRYWVKSYVLSGPELFARGYMQYIATRSGSADLADIVRRNQTDAAGRVSSQWNDDDFAPIADAFDDLFRAKGWLKEPQAAKGEWREELHPREAAGSPKGGEFAPKDGETGPGLPDLFNVSSAFAPELGNAVERALRMLDRVHGVSGVTIKDTNGYGRIVIASFPGDPLVPGGRYTSLPDGRVFGISLSDALNPKFVPAALAHEIGHALDQQVWGWGSSRPGSDLAEVMQAIDATAEVKRLREFAARGDVVVKRDAYVLPGRNYKMDMVNGEAVKRVALSDEQRKYLDYLTDPHELFARAYAQYAARRMRDPDTTEYLGWGAKSQLPEQWSSASFEPIDAAMTRLFVAKGWDRGR